MSSTEIDTANLCSDSTEIDTAVLCAGSSLYMVDVYEFSGMMSPSTSLVLHFDNTILWFTSSSFCIMATRASTDCSA